MFLITFSIYHRRKQKLAGYTYVTHVLNSTDTTIPTHRVKRKFKQRVLQLHQTWAINKIKLKRGKVVSATRLADL